MDVRCEKCQTEYELDEARLKPGGVTVKCTNCGHMFKIRKRTPTNAGVPAVQQVSESARVKQASRPNPTVKPGRADSIFDEAVTTSQSGEEGPTTIDRQWLIRLENGDQKSCRELATLQQWIVAGVVTRESLISRSGKTWKRLGDIGELVQYFDIADEARTTRDERRMHPTPKPPHRDDAPRGTMLGVGKQGPMAAGGTILPDDEEDRRTTGSFRSPARPATKPPPPLPGGKVPTKTPPMGSISGSPQQPAPVAAAPAAGSPPQRRPLTTPPPPPPKRADPPPPAAAASELPNLKGPPTDGNRATAAWATDGADKVGAAGPAPSAAGPSGPFVGKLSAIPDEPAFARPGAANMPGHSYPDGGAGRVRVAPPESSTFDAGIGSGRIRADDDDDELMPRRRSSSVAWMILFAVLIVGGAGGFAVWWFAIREPKKVAGIPDAGTVAETPQVDAPTPVITPVVDAAPEVPVPSPLEAARGELARDDEAAVKKAYDSLAGTEGAPAQAVRAQLGTALAQALVDRATLLEKGDGEKLRKDSKTIVLEAATAAQKAHKATPDDAAANLAMAHVLRLQGKPARDVKKYLDAAKAQPGDWARDVALADALLLKRDGKLADAKTAFAAIDSGDGKLETSNDVRARFQLALIAFAEQRAADAKPLVEQVLAAQPEHAGAKALAAKLDTRVATDDPLPPEDGPKQGSGGSAKPPDRDPPLTGDYDTLVRRGDQVANTSCVKAIEIYSKALEKKPNGVEALTGLGYCHLDAKNFASAHSRFRTALVISARYEPALAGIAEAYQQQGRKDDAIAAWRRYLEAYPGSKKATSALDRLGAGASDTPPPGGGSGSAEQPPQPPPQPPPPPDGTGAGSGSG